MFPAMLEHPGNVAKPFRKGSAMSTVSSHAFSYNGDGHLIGNSRFQSGCPDELSPELAAEMDAHFGYRMPPTDVEIDLQYEREMIRRDTMASNAGIEQSVGMATGGRFTAVVRQGKRLFKLGKFLTERAAWLACEHKAAELRREYMRIV